LIRVTIEERSNTSAGHYKRDNWYWVTMGQNGTLMTGLRDDSGSRARGARSMFKEASMKVDKQELMTLAAVQGLTHQVHMLVIYGNRHI
jgi:hypothetical protein